MLHNINKNQEVMKQLHTFAVAKKANKPLIKMAVENLFGVKVVKIRITQKKPKIRITGRTRAKIKVAGVKKAIVTLAANQKIPLFEFEAEKK